MKTHYKNTNKKKTIVVLFRYKYPLVGLQDIIQRIILLSKYYNVILITNHEYVSLKKQNIKFIIIKNIKVFDIYYYLLVARLKLLFIKYDAIFIAGINYSLINSLGISKPVICYGNVNPLQICGIKKKVPIKKYEGNKFNYLKRILKLHLHYMNLRKCSKILVISKHLQTDYVRNNINQSKIETIYMGVDTKVFFRESNKKNKRFTIIYSGTITEERGLNTIMSALKILSEITDNFIFKFVGCDNVIKETIYSSAKNLGIKDNIKCVPIIGIKKSAKHIREADVGISLLENNDYFKTSPPTKIFEYMASGIPVIANKISTHTSYIKNNYNGLIIDNTSEELSKAILKMYKNRTLMKKMAINSYNESKKYSWDKQKNIYISVFKEILK
jgi:glycosyltransferase involved in cell wall biosynthesis